MSHLSPPTWQSLGSTLSSVHSSPSSQLINYEEIFDLLLCLTRRILIKSHSGFGSFTKRYKPDARLPLVTNDLLGNSDFTKWPQPFTLDISSAFSSLIIALYGLCLQQPGL